MTSDLTPGCVCLLQASPTLQAHWRLSKRYQIPVLIPWCADYSQRELDSRVRLPGLESWPFLLTSCGTLGRGLNLSEPQFPHLADEDSKSASHTGV